MAEPATIEAAAPNRDGGLTRREHRRLIAALSVTQTIGYGVLYYAFAVFLTSIAASLHTGLTAVAGALTVAVVVTGAAGILVGRWVDRHGGHRLMTAGSLLGGSAIIAWSQVHTLVELYAGFIAIGVASAMVLYEPAFAVIIRAVVIQQRANALLAVTIVAGFASTVFLPLTGLLNAHLGWRHALLALAAIYLATTVPLHALYLPRDDRRRSPSAELRRTAVRGHVRRALGDRGFWFLLTGFAAQGAAVAVIGVLLITYLIRLGHTPVFAAAVAGLLGVLSVTGRLVTTGLRRRLPIGDITAGVFAFQAAGVAALPWLGAATVGAVACVTVIGIGFGVATIARPAILADRYDTTAYASISATMAAPMNAAKATAPLAATAVAASGAGYTTVMIVTAAALLVAAAALTCESYSRA